MSRLSLEDFQDEFPVSRSRIAGAEWAWRDTDPASGRTPLVFLPGAGGTGDVFFRTAYALRDVRRVITLRYPALSDARAMAAGIVDLLGICSSQRFDVAGSSLGGYVAQLIAADRPELVRRALFGNTFVDPSWFQAKLSREAVLATPAADHLARTLAQLRALPEASEEQADYKRTMLALVGSEQNAEMVRSSLAAVLGAEPVPPVDMPAASVAILDAADDPVVDAPTREAVRRRYAHSPHYALPRGGHYPSLLNPKAYADAVRRHFGTE